VIDRDATQTTSTWMDGYGYLTYARPANTATAVFSVYPDYINQLPLSLPVSGQGLVELAGEGAVVWANAAGTLTDLVRVRSPAQEALQPELTALVATVTGYVDHTMDRIGSSLIGSYGMITEALRRRRVEADQSDRFVERILGLELDRAQYDRGSAFAAGVVERAGEEALARLFEGSELLPTPTEVDAPGLWLARIELPD